MNGQTSCRTLLRTTHLLFAVAFLLVVSSTALGQQTPRTNVYAGGINGLTSLLQESNSDDFRTKGGGLFLHNSGWGKLSDRQREDLLKVFKGKPIAIEIGYHGGHEAWASNLKGYYIDKGINPHFVTCNLMAEGHDPSFVEWRDRHDKLKRIAPDALIFPTFEYANFEKNKKTLIQVRVSNTVRLQRIIEQSKGIVLDVPPGHFFEREPAYRNWIIDAIRYANGKGYTTVVIMSPHKSGASFNAHADMFLRVLRQYNAIPDVYVVENYIGGNDYPNKIGDEDSPNTVLGVANAIVQSFAVRPNSSGRSMKRTTDNPESVSRQSNSSSKPKIESRIEDADIPGIETKPTDAPTKHALFLMRHVSKGDYNWFTANEDEANDLSKQGYWEKGAPLGHVIGWQAPSTVPLVRWRTASGATVYSLGAPTKPKNPIGVYGWVWTEEMPGLMTVYALKNQSGRWQLTSLTEHRDRLTSEFGWRMMFTFYMLPPN